MIWEKFLQADARREAIAANRTRMREVDKLHTPFKVRGATLQYDAIAQKFVNPSAMVTPRPKVDPMKVTIRRTNVVDILLDMRRRGMTQAEVMKHAREAGWLTDKPMLPEVTLPQAPRRMTQGNRVGYVYTDTTIDSEVCLMDIAMERGRPEVYARAMETMGEEMVCE